MQDEDLKHDPLDQNQDENVLEAEQVEKETDTFEVKSAEESAMNTDNEVAMEANEGTMSSPELEAEAAIVEEALEKKHKNRESTSEKAKKAALVRKEKGASVTGEPVSTKALDPLRLRGKKYRAKIALLEAGRVYSIEEALKLVKESSYASFDAAVEMHIKVKGEAVRGTVSLPNGSGKTKKVAIATDETIEAIAAGKLDFDVLLATPAQMPKLAKHAKVLGPKGLMPSPKAGTVTDDVEKVAAEIGGGRIEYRADKNNVVHVSIGRVSFAVEKLVENYQTIEQALVNAKVQTISVASTMGPGIKVALTK